MGSLYGRNLQQIHKNLYQLKQFVIQRFIVIEKAQSNQARKNCNFVVFGFLKSSFLLHIFLTVCINNILKGIGLTTK